jgi:hypothetical protein
MGESFADGFAEAASSQAGGSTAMLIMTGRDLDRLTNISHSWRRRYLTEVLHLLYLGACARLGALL